MGSPLGSRAMVTAHVFESVILPKPVESVSRPARKETTNQNQDHLTVQWPTPEMECPRLVVCRCNPKPDYSPNHHRGTKNEDDESSGAGIKQTKSPPKRLVIA